ncbi:MAG: hypothetical protein IPO77_17840 [Acidobacteria bacterium]|nr:hypothetical protein [Acidobacteriota bacterium]
MNRRSFLALGAGAAALPAINLNTFAGNSAWPSSAHSVARQSRKLNRLRLSVTWGMMSRMPIPDALAKLNDLGYDAYEMFNWRDQKTRYLSCRSPEVSQPGLCDARLQQRRHRIGMRSGQSERA